MTESYVSPSEIRQYWSTQERVKYWVQTHADEVFSSPNAPPSEIEGEDGALSSAVSDVESSHSLPPKFALQYHDGRTVPIPHPSSPNIDQEDLGLHHPSSGKHSSNQDGVPHSSHRSRSGSAPSKHSSRHPASPHSERREREKLRSHSPEEILILPSEHTPDAPVNEISRSVSHTSHHTRSRSLPRDAYPSQSPQNHDPMPFTTSQHSSHSREGYHTPPGGPIQIPHTPPHNHKINLARSQPIAWHPYANGARMTPMPPQNHMRHPYNPKHVPPAIVYAPSSNSRSHYNPPAIYSYPPNFGPNGVMYSHSVPPTKQYRHVHAPYSSAGAPSVAGPPYPPQVLPHPQEPQDQSHRPRQVRSHSNHQSVDERFVHVSRGTNGSSKSKKSSRSKKSGRARANSLPLEEAVRSSVETPPRSPSPTNSNASGSTYYVLPTGRQKVHVIRPNQSNTIFTATSSTKSPTTPISPAGSIKKPFFARLKGLAERLSSAGSSRSSNGSARRVHRRHSTGNSSQGRGPEPS